MSILLERNEKCGILVTPDGVPVRCFCGTISGNRGRIDPVQPVDKCKVWKPRPAPDWRMG